MYRSKGTVTSSGSAAVTVTLWAEPDQEFQSAALAQGQEIRMREVQSVPAVGSYTVTLDPASLGPDYVATDGHVQAWVAATTPNGKMAIWGVPVLSGQTSAIQVPTLNMDTAPRIGTETRRPGCGQIYWHNINGPYNTKVLDVYAQGPVQGNGTYMYTTSTSTTLGFLIKPAGGDWGAGGTWVDSDRNGAGFSANVKDKRLQALWRYRERTVTCWPYVQNLPWDYVGKGLEVALAHVNLSNCGNLYHAGDVYLRTSHANQTYSFGVYVYGIGLTSQAGLHTSMRLKFTFNGNGKVCGNTGQAENAPIVEASVP